MIGFYDYTVVLTYFSLLSAMTGIIVSLSGSGHPYYGCLFLLFCGLFDAFDGKVARTKKGRTKMEMDFGIQIDSLSDLVAFGVLPACIGAALIRVSPYLTRVLEGMTVRWEIASGKFLLHACLVLYVLAALIRLAYYNVTEEERQQAAHLALMLVDDHRSAWRVEGGRIVFTDPKVEEEFRFYTMPTDGSAARWKRDFGKEGGSTP